MVIHVMLRRRILLFMSVGGLPAWVWRFQSMCERLECFVTTLVILGSRLCLRVGLLFIAGVSVELVKALYSRLCCCFWWLSIPPFFDFLSIRPLSNPCLDTSAWKLLNTSGVELETFYRLLIGSTIAHYTGLLPMQSCIVTYLSTLFFLFQSCTVYVFTWNVIFIMWSL